MKILVIGSGAREHTIAWKLKQSKRVSDIFVAPGNAGISEIANIVDIKADDIDGLLKFAKSEKIDLTFVGPEVPLVEGIVDEFIGEGLRIFGPDKHGALFEGSKAYSKAFMIGNDIPTAKYIEFTNLTAAKDAIGIYGYPFVIKADGLAAGKGVVICQSLEEATETINSMMEDKVFGDAGDKIIFEEFLTGIEASVLCFVDGKTIKPMASAQDYKKAYDGDEGLNTGGMGAYSPSRLFDEKLEKHIDETILQPFLQGTINEGIDYKGIIFIGLMIEDDVAKVIEFNCRLGDPETQVVLPRLKNDLVDVVEACIDGKLDEVNLEWIDESAVCVVVASGGYPGSYEKNKVITGLNTEDSIIFHAGTKKSGEDVVTDGGRVLSVVSISDSIEEAREISYTSLKNISFEDMMFRTDIAK